MIDFLNDKKYIISLPSRPDRRDSLEKEIGKIGLVNYEYFWGIDGKDLGGVSKLKSGQLGCKVSHSRIIQNAQNENLAYVIILEDDVRFIEDFSVKLSLCMNQVPEDWDIIYLGGHHFKPLNMITGQVGKCTGTLSTVCYIVRNTVYKLILEELRKDKILDMIYMEIIQPKVNAYGFKPNLVTQASGFSDVEGRMIDYTKFYNK